MSNTTDGTIDADLKAWLRSQLDAAVEAFGKQQVFDDFFVETKPAWAFPMRILLGQARALNNPQSFRWFICGEVKFDHVEDSMAATPREALRHFAMKWQIDANRIDNQVEAPLRTTLIKNAELLYELSEEDSLW